MFDPSAGDVLFMIIIGALYFHLGRMAGYRVGYLKGRKAVQAYYDKKERVKA
jgi:mannose/fructose/N-acetylgalactosamine-specific phosphotransferase system component IID